MSTVQCPHCFRMFSAPPSLHGRRVVCPACKGEFLCPGQSGPTAGPSASRPATNRTQGIGPQSAVSAQVGSGQSLPGPTSPSMHCSHGPSDAGAVSAQHQWCYLLEGFLSDDLEGPVSEKAFLREIHAGRIGPKAKVMSPSVTRGVWVRLQSLPSYHSVWQEGEAERQQIKQDQAEAKRRQRVLKAQKKAEQETPETVPSTNLPKIALVSSAVCICIATPTLTAWASVVLGGFPLSIGIALGAVALGALAVTVLLVIGVYCCVAPPRCPKCGRRGGYRTVGSVIVAQQPGYGLVTRHARSTHFGDAFRGTDSIRTVSFGTTTYQERVPVVRTTYRVTFQCQHCSALLWHDRVEEAEDFG